MSYEALCSKLRCLPIQSLVGIEGFCSSGKSRLADQLAKNIPAHVFHTDDFATKHDDPPPYLDCLKLTELAATVASRGKSSVSIIEGICLRDVLSACAIDADLFLYIKRMGRNGLWYDGLHLEDFDERSPVDGDELEPHLSDLEYHSRVRPHERADLVYLRVEED